MAENEIPTIEQFRENLGKIAYTLDKEYASRLTEDYLVLPYDEEYNVEPVKDESGNTEYVEINSYVSNVRALKINRLVYDSEEDFADCMQNAISIFSNSGKTLAFVFNRFKTHTEIYAVTKNDGQGKNEESKADINLFKDSFIGNFTGSKLDVIEEKHSGNDTKELFGKDGDSIIDKVESIAAVCNIPSAKSEEYLSQNLEKLFNGIVPSNDDEWYSVIVFAEALSKDKIHGIRDGLEELATDVFPFMQHQFQASENESKTEGEMKSLAHSDNMSTAISKTHSLNIGGHASAKSDEGSAKSDEGSVGVNGGYGYSWGKTETKGTTDTYTRGTNNSITLGTSQANTYSFQSYTVKNIVERLEQNLERLKIGDAIGLWKYATYVCAASSRISVNVANYIKALTQGKESFVEPAVVNEWHKELGNGLSDFDQIKKYIFNFTHPVFVNKKDGMMVNFTANVSTYELANIMSLPQNSIPGIPVTHGVTFGREPHSISDLNLDLKFGVGYHMYQINNNQSINISKEELKKHTFITGSTGAGKSNTIYQMLSNLNKQDVKFLVVEPAKGEYKDVLGRNKDVITFGTNPSMKGIQLLKINPFRFPSNTHILEHLDRLIEIFNVCWPMYAAMPAILKDSVERAYRDAGWDMITSKNKYGEPIYPTFVDVVEQIKVVLDESDYSADNKGDYTGSLVTRLKSLTNGINGIVFSADDIPDDVLFDNNVIVDLSRVGSTETKALIMGLLVLKLQEHRMENPTPNSDLKHVTVLEEAHNILKRTSTEQSSESSNLLGKSVELLANSIAEMRTYGEGFIIADQSPGLLDMSVIRNTNTKIIMRIPDMSDRELVGKAAGLNDKQIEEIGRFDTGVAAVVQSGWLEPVLCKIDRYDEPSNDDLECSNVLAEIIDTSILKQSILDCIMNKELYRKGDRVDIQKLYELVVKSNLDARTKSAFLDYISAEKENAVKQLRKLAFEFLKTSSAIKQSKKNSDVKKWVHAVVDHLDPSVKGYSKTQIDILMGLLIYEQTERDSNYNDILCKYTEIYKKKGGVF